MLLKFEFIEGLEWVLQEELDLIPEFKLIDKSPGVAVVESDAHLNIARLLQINSANNIYLLYRSHALNPIYLANHLDILDRLISQIFGQIDKKWKTFNVNAAGSGSPQLLHIKKHIVGKFSMKEVVESSDADLQINYGKVGDHWELALRISDRPLSARWWHIGNIRGGMNPTIAYAMNRMAEISEGDSLLNPFCGSATLIGESRNWNLSKIIGIDRDNEAVQEAVKNLKKLEMIKKVDLKAIDFDEFESAEKFDVIYANLPFGQQVKAGNLEDLYAKAVRRSNELLKKGGRLLFYTSKTDLIEKAFASEGISNVSTLNLKFKDIRGKSVETSIYLWKK